MKKLNSNLLKIVNILNDTQFHAGDEIGNKLGITRSAIWKAIKKLNKYQIKVTSIKGKGYAMQEPLVLLDDKKIKQVLDPAIKKDIDLTLLETTDSTNNYLKKISSKNRFKICLAEHLTQARGRFQRAWHAPFGQNIYLSCQYRFAKDLSELAGLSLVIGLAIIKTLHEFGLNNKIMIKWPNDILWQRRKLAGTLIEVSAETHGHCEAMIGIGLNVNMLDADNDVVSQPWASLRQIQNKYFDRNVVVAALINHLVNYIQQFELHGLAHFMEEWNASDCLLGQSVTIINGKEEVQGLAQGINEQGHLLLKLPNGRTHAFSSGDASVKKT